MKNLKWMMMAGVVLIGGSLYAQQQTPLGDVVKQNKPTKKASRVITDEDMPSHPEPAPEPAITGAALSSEKGSAVADGAAKADDKKPAAAADKSAKVDSPEVTAMKSRVKELDSDINHMQRMLKGTEDASVNDPDPERRAIFENVSKNHRYSLQHAMDEKAELNKKIEEAKSKDESKKAEDDKKSDDAKKSE